MPVLRLFYIWHVNTYEEGEPPLSTAYLFIQMRIIIQVVDVRISV